MGERLGQAGSGNAATVPAAAPAGHGDRDVVADGNRFGRTSELRLEAAVRDGRTVVLGMFATMPFKVMHPLALDTLSLPCRDDSVAGTDSRVRGAEVMVMSVSAGIMAGDRQLIDIEAGEGSVLRVTNQAFEKIHRMDDGAEARRETEIRVAPGAYLDYAPLPQIPFAGSAFSTRTRVSLADRSSAFIYSEILSCGRVARGERFAYRRYRNRVRIDVAGHPVFIDNTDYRPGGEPGDMDMEGTGLYEGFSHLANLVLVNLGIDEARFAAVRAYLLGETGVIGDAARADDDAADTETVAGGITRLASGDCLVKVLGNRAQRLQQVLEGVRARMR